MGASSSQPEEKQTLVKKKGRNDYQTPDERFKSRFVPVENTSFTSAYEASIDKFDYLIVFPLTEGPYLSPTKYEDNDRSRRIRWSVIQETWKKAVPGSEEVKEKALKRLKKAWKARTNSDPKDEEEIRWNAWLTIAREAIIDHLSTRCGLQLKLSANSSHIFCRIRAPIKLLELQADKENYPLQFRGEIDPGSEEFWNRTDKHGVPLEIVEEQREIELEEAKYILERLYRANKISPNDLSINPDQENKSTYSRRVHALERIADKVPIFNKYIAYSPFQSTKTHLRYLYQTYPNVRGHTLFRSKDRLLLTKSIIDNQFDMDILADNEVVDTFLALHDANRGEKLTVDSLSRLWVTFWVPPADEAGAPSVTHEAYEDGEELWWYLRPFSQPLKQIREYFGEKVAMYYAWYGFFTYYLIIPSILGLSVMLLWYLRGYEDTVEHFDIPMYIYAFLIITWAKVYEQSWKQECIAVAVKWGTRGFESEESDRPQFHGDPEHPVERSLVTNRNETYFPDSKRTWIQFGSWIVIALIISIDIAIICGVMYAQYLYINPDSDDITSEDATVYVWIVSILLALLVPICSYIFYQIAIILNDNENHRTDTNYEDNLVIKILGFECFNSFFAAMFTAFIKDPYFSSCYETCVYDLRVLLYAIVIVRLAKTILNLLYTSLMSYVHKLWSYSNGGDGSNDGFSGDNNDDNPGRKEEQQRMLLSESGDETQFMSEITREEYKGTFQNFAEAYMQFGYINLFGVIMPILPVITLIENLIKIRIDAYRLCALMRRPHVEQAEDAGYWAQNISLMIDAGIVMVTALFIFTESDVEEYSIYIKIIALLAISNILWAYVRWIEYVIPQTTDEMQEIIDRQQFIVDKFAKGFEDNDENLDISALKGNLDDTIDVDSLNLYDMRKGMKVTDEEYTRMEDLEKKRRDLLREQKLTRERLQEVYKTETFNESTGVGETKHGLPLGRLSVRLVEIQNFIDEELEGLGKAQLIIRISFKGTKQGASAPVPNFGNLTDSQKLSIVNGTISINQSLGPYAPIRTIDADVIFDILNLSNNEASIATTSVKLRELLDQQQQNKILPLSIRNVEGNLKPSNAKLYVNLTFQYSKIVPIRKKLYDILDKLQTLEKELSRLKSGKQDTSSMV